VPRAVQDETAMLNSTLAYEEVEKYAKSVVEFDVSRCRRCCKLR
jgi:hypothetical protein